MNNLTQVEPDVKLINCPDCKGEGSNWDYVTGTSVKIDPCDRCQESGEVPADFIYNDLTLSFGAWQAQESELVEDWLPW